MHYKKDRTFGAEYMGKREKVSDEQIKEIFRQRKIPPTQYELAIIFNVSVPYIRKRLRDLGLKTRGMEKKKTLSSEQVREEYRKYIEEYHQLPSQQELVRRLNVSESLVAIKLRELGLKTGGQFKKMLRKKGEFRNPTWGEIKRILESL
jgi:Zn-dependent peptidase ImmA (M78 family)